MKKGGKYAQAQRRRHQKLFWQADFSATDARSTHLLRFLNAVTIIYADFFRMTGMECRPGCGACCIAPSISSAMPGMPNGKPAGVRCAHLTEANFCGLFGQPTRPAVCAAFSADRSVCGESLEEAIHLLGWLEQATA